MCKKRIVLVFCVSVLFSGAAIAEVDDSGRLIVPQTSVAPVIDGVIDDVWQNVGEESLLITEIINATSAVPEDESDLSSTFKVMYDDDNFYFFIAVQDSVLDYEFSDWRGDSVEIFFDGDNSKGSSYDGVNDNQIRINIDDVELSDIGSSLPVDGTAFKVLLTDVGYNIEAAFPLAVLQIIPANTFGFEVQLNDNDGSGGRETLIRWFSNDNNSWQDASLFGEAVLIPTPVPVDPGTEGLVAFYALDGDLSDGSDNDLDGAMIGEPNFVEGIVGMALDLDGVDDVVELGKFDLNGQITLAAWIKADDFEINDARVISKAKEWGGNDHWWMLSTISETSLRFRLKTDDGQETATLISDPVLEVGVWAHVAVTWDDGMMRIYKDGAEVAGQEKGGSAVAVDPNISVAIGSQPSDAFASDPGHVAKFFDGLIDEAVLYERALSEGELLYLAGFRIEPIGAWNLDEGSGAIAVDDSGNGLDGAVIGAVWASPGVNGTGFCLDFDGQGDNLVDLGNFDVTTGTGLSISCWYKADNLDTPGNDPRLFSKAIGGASQDHWFMLSSSRVGGDKVLRFRLKTDEDTGELKADTTTGIVDLDVWTHAAAVWDGATMKLYKNGVEVGNLDKGGILSTNPDANVAIGNQPVGTPSRPWDGLIDDVQLYNRGLSPAEILELAGQ